MHDQMKRLYKAALDLKKIEGQSAVAAAMNVSPQRVNNWEARGISNQGMLAAERAFGCSAIWLETGQGNMVAGGNALAPPSEHPDAPSLIKAVHAVDAVLAVDGITLEYEKYLDLITYVADRLRKNEAEENIGLSRLIKLLT